MNWVAWWLVAILVLNVIATIARIGEPREPLTSADAIAVLIVNALILWSVLSLAGVA